ncbi:MULTISPECIES: hypothetical protein [unclassified Streptomyces]|uniref:hypothetical protein n=1 Tax=unclassified Streptomyces TaxID=2593676 RepID=UPI002E1F1A39|nr:hypothetical protein OG217_37675 [Streptomyces sp. NBC_01023]
MPKNQSTAAQSARKDARRGAKYTESLRLRNAAAGTEAAPTGAPVLRFLAEGGGNLYHLVGGITAAWAHSGQRILLLEEAEDYWQWSMTFHSRGRRKRAAPAAPPEPVTSTLFTSSTGSGALVHHSCMWEARHPSKESNRGLPRTDRSPLKEAIDSARNTYDVVVLLPRLGWSYPDRENATAHVVLGEVDVFPHTDCRVVMPGTGGEEQGVPLSPEQSAAVLRERCLSFLFGSPRPPCNWAG